MANDLLRGRQTVVPLVNKSGGGVVAGDVVILSSADASAFITTTTAAQTADWVGVALETIANNGTGRVCLFGYVPLVNLASSASLGDYIRTHTSAKTAQRFSSTGAGDFGQVLETGATPSAVLWGRPDQGTGGIRVDEGDGAPDVTGVTRITVSNGTLTDNTGGHVTLTTGGGGGGAPTTVPYVTTAADGTLSAEKVLPFLGNYSPDKAPASPSGTDDEFDDQSLGGSWTSTGSPDTLDETTYKGYLLIEDNDGADAGAYIGYTPGANALSVACKIKGFNYPGENSFVGMVLTDSSGTALCTLTLQRVTSAAIRARTGATGLTNANLFGSYSESDWYLLIQRDASTNYLCFVSRDGMCWMQVASFSQAGTIARAYLIVDGQNSGVAQATFDFIRMFTSQTKVIGAAP